MKLRKSRVLWLGLSLILALVLGAASPLKTTGSARVAADSSNQLAVALLPLLDRPEQNALFSPVSISTALAMLSTGAAGQTEAELLRVLGRKAGDSGVHADFSMLLREMDLSELKIANRLWVDSKLALLPAFVSTTRESYNASVEALDFAHSAESARQRINSWVEERTNRKILDLLKSGDVSSVTRLVLANAVYLKADWESPFLKTSTQSASFTLTKGKVVQVPMMSWKEHARFLENELVQAVLLPYKGGVLTASFLLAAPGKRFDLLQTLRELDASDDPRVQVYLPRFKFSHRTDLNSLLARAGASQVFDPAKADLSRISGTRDLYLSRAVHQAFIEVNETGTEAAAATAMMVNLTALPEPEPKIFRADRPFLVVIRHAPTGAILFLAKIQNPIL